MQAVIDQVATVPALAGRVHSAAKLAQLSERGGLAQVSPAAFVLPLGLRGGSPDAVTGLFRQRLDRLVGVVIVVRNAGDGTGAAAMVELDPLVDSVIAAVAGWGPDDAAGVFSLARGELVSLVTGTITYQLDFQLEDQLRIAR